jgi:hypothetical protein
MSRQAFAFERPKRPRAAGGFDDDDDDEAVEGPAALSTGGSRVQLSPALQRRRFEEREAFFFASSTMDALPPAITLPAPSPIDFDDDDPDGSQRPSPARGGRPAPTPPPLCRSTMGHPNSTAAGGRTTVLNVMISWTGRVSRVTVADGETLGSVRWRVLHDVAGVDQRALTTAWNAAAVPGRRRSLPWRLVVRGHELPHDTAVDGEPAVRALPDASTVVVLAPRA